MGTGSCLVPLLTARRGPGREGVLHALECIQNQNELDDGGSLIRDRASKDVDEVGLDLDWRKR